MKQTDYVENALKQLLTQSPKITFTRGIEDREDLEFLESDIHSYTTLKLAKYIKDKLELPDVANDIIEHSINGKIFLSIDDQYPLPGLVFKHKLHEMKLLSHIKRLRSINLKHYNQPKKDKFVQKLSTSASMERLNSHQEGPKKLTQKDASAMFSAKYLIDHGGFNADSIPILAALRYNYNYNRLKELLFNENDRSYEIIKKQLRNDFPVQSFQDSDNKQSGKTTKPVELADEDITATINYLRALIRPLVEEEILNASMNIKTETTNNNNNSIKNNNQTTKALSKTELSNAIETSGETKPIFAAVKAPTINSTSKSASTQNTAISKLNTTEKLTPTQTSTSVAPSILESRDFLTALQRERAEIMSQLQEMHRSLHSQHLQISQLQANIQQLESEKSDLLARRRADELAGVRRVSELAIGQLSAENRLASEQLQHSQLMLETLMRAQREKLAERAASLQRDLRRIQLQSPTAAVSSDIGRPATDFSTPSMTLLNEQQTKEIIDNLLRAEAILQTRELPPPASDGQPTPPVQTIQIILPPPTTAVETTERRNTAENQSNAQTQNNNAHNNANNNAVNPNAVKTAVNTTVNTDASAVSTAVKTALKSPAAQVSGAGMSSKSVDLKALLSQQCDVEVSLFEKILRDFKLKKVDGQKIFNRGPAFYSLVSDSRQLALEVGRRWTFLGERIIHDKLIAAITEKLLRQILSGAGQSSLQLCQSEYLRSIVCTYALMTIHRLFAKLNDQQPQLAFLLSQLQRGEFPWRSFEISRESMREFMQKYLQFTQMDWSQFDALMQRIDIQHRGFVFLEDILHFFMHLSPAIVTTSTHTSTTDSTSTSTAISTSSKSKERETHRSALRKKFLLPRDNLSTTRQVNHGRGGADAEWRELKLNQWISLMLCTLASDFFISLCAKHTSTSTSTSTSLSAVSPGKVDLNQVWLRFLSDRRSDRPSFHEYLLTVESEVQLQRHGLVFDSRTNIDPRDKPAMDGRLVQQQAFFSELLAEMAGAQLSNAEQLLPMTAQREILLHSRFTAGQRQTVADFRRWLADLDDPTVTDALRHLASHVEECAHVTSKACDMYSACHERDALVTFTDFLLAIGDARRATAEMKLRAQGRDGRRRQDAEIFTAVRDKLVWFQRSTADSTADMSALTTKQLFDYERAIGRRLAIYLPVCRHNHDPDDTSIHNIDINNNNIENNNHNDNENSDLDDDQQLVNNKTNNNINNNNNNNPSNISNTNNSNNTSTHLPLLLECQSIVELVLHETHVTLDVLPDTQTFKSPDTTTSHIKPLGASNKSQATNDNAQLTALLRAELFDRGEVERSVSLQESVTEFSRAQRQAQVNDFLSLLQQRAQLKKKLLKTLMDLWRATKLLLGRGQRQRRMDQSMDMDMDLDIQQLSLSAPEILQQTQKIQNELMREMQSREQTRATQLERRVQWLLEVQDELEEEYSAGAGPLQTAWQELKMSLLEVKALQNALLQANNDAMRLSMRIIQRLTK